MRVSYFSILASCTSKLLPCSLRLCSCHSCLTSKHLKRASIIGLTGPVMSMGLTSCLLDIVGSSVGNGDYKVHLMRLRSARRERLFVVWRWDRPPHRDDRDEYHWIINFYGHFGARNLGHPCHLFLDCPFSHVREHPDVLLLTKIWCERLHGLASPFQDALYIV